MSFVFLYVTTSTKEEATLIATSLLRRKLVACANLFPIHSIYRWKGKIERQQETTLILKTTRKKVMLIRKEIESLHSYDIPCITEIAVKPNQKYGDWMLKQLV